MSDPKSSIGEQIAEHRYALIFLLLLAAVYFSLPTKNYYWDGILYAQFIEDSDAFGWHLIHPNHLLYNVLGYAAYSTVRSIGLDIRALFVLQFLTTVFAIACALFFYLISIRLFRSQYVAIVLTALLSFAAGWWRFSTDANVYIISIAFLLAAFYFVLPGGRPLPVLVAVVHTIAMLFHELGVLFCPVLAIGIVMQSSPGEKLFNMLKYTVIAVILTLGTYCVSFYFLTGDFNTGEFARWVTSFAPDPGVSPTVVESLQMTLKGTRQMFVDGSTRLMSRDVVSIGAFALFCIAALVLIFTVVKALPRIGAFLKTIGPSLDERRTTLIIAAVWILPYAVFLFFFMPGNLFYRLFYLPALIIVIGVVLAGSNEPVGNRTAALIAIVFALYNFIFYIYPNSKVIADTPLAVAFTANSEWPGETTVIYRSTNVHRIPDTNDRLVRYFNPATRWINVDDVTVDGLENYGKGRLWVESTALESAMADDRLSHEIASRFRTESPPAMSSPKYKLAYIRLVPRVQN